MDKLKLKHYIIIITYGIVLFLGLMNLSSVFEGLGVLSRVFIPLIYGLVIAYLINIPYKWFRKKVFVSLEQRKGKIGKTATILSLICAYATVLLIVALLFRFIIPQLISSITQLVINIPYYFSSLESFVTRIVEYFGLGNFIGEQVWNTWTDLNAKAGTILTDVLPYVANYLLSFTSGIFNWLIGLVISIYMLFSKDTLIRQMTRLLLAFGPKRYINRIIELSARANLIFNRFIAGDMIDALIVGIICFLATSIMQTPYSLLVSVLVGVTNLIPIFGPFIGAIPSIFIILIDDPFKALLFLIFIFALQQVDGNIIKPLIFGSTVGLPSLWVLLSIVVGGGLFGIVGMLLAVPTFALIYSIVRDEVNVRLKDQ